MSFLSKLFTSRLENTKLKYRSRYLCNCN